MAATQAGKTDTRIVHLEPGMYIVRFDGRPTLGESAVLSLAPGYPGSKLDFFESEAVTNNTLSSTEDCIVVRCSGDAGNILITSLSLTSPALVGARVDKIASSIEKSESNTAAPVSRLKTPVAPELPGLSGHIEWKGDVTAGLGAWLGDSDGHNRLEGFSVAWENKPADVDIAYSSIIGSLGRSPVVLTGEFCGTRQRAAPITAVTFSLVGKQASKYNLEVEVAFDGAPIQKLQSGVEGRGVTGREHLVALRLKVTNN